MGVSQSKLSPMPDHVSASAAGAGATAAEQDTGQPLPPGMEAIFKNTIFPSLGIKNQADDSAAAGTSGKDEIDLSDAGAGAPEAKEPIWLNFIATPIRDDINPNTVEHVSLLYRTNKFFRGEMSHHIDRSTQQLLALVLNGREAEAKALITACPFLLERRATVTDPVGRVYEDITAYEAALYAGDKQMREMMHPFFEKLRGDGEVIRSKQCHNVFPMGVQAVINVQPTYNFDSLIAAIHFASSEDVEDQLQKKITYTALGKAINQFRSNFMALSKQEQHANLKHLLKAFWLYAEDERIVAWEREGKYDKMRVFWRQVIGFVQLYLPECDKQAFHQGLYAVVERNERLSRAADFEEDRGFSLHLVGGLSACGFDYAATGGGIRPGVPPACEGMADQRSVLLRLISRKNIKPRETLQPQTDHAVPCMIQ